MEYTISVLTFLPDGGIVESVADTRLPIVAKDENKDLVCNFEIFKLEGVAGDVEEATCVIDEIAKHNQVWKVRGFAFKNMNAYQYKKYIVLQSEYGETLKIETIDEERRDVVTHFAEKCYLLNAGFICNILEDCIQKGQRYRIGVLFQNRYTGEQSLIMTGTEIQG